MKTLITLALVLVTVSIQQASSIRASSTHPSHGPEVDTLFVDTESSEIKWKGTKFWGMGKHEGTIQVSAGALYIEDGSITGGWFEIDMYSIEVTDIPKTDPVPRNRLRNHLMNDDFFAVETYPTSRFVITKATEEKAGKYILNGNLTMRGVTHPISFDVTTRSPSDKTMHATASISFNRHKWGIAFRGSKLTNDLVDDLILLNVQLKCNSL